LRLRQKGGFGGKREREAVKLFGEREVGVQDDHIALKYQTNERGTTRAQKKKKPVREKGVAERLMGGKS